MALTRFPLLGGVYKDDTPSSAEGYATDSSGVRFYREKWQTMGGYSLAVGQTLDGIVRGARTWADLAGIKIAAFGAADWLKVFYNGSIADITPLKAKGTLVDPFATQNGNTLVFVFSPAHGLKSGDMVTFALGNAVGGLTLNGTFEVTVVGFDVYTIVSGSAASSDAAGGGKVEYQVPLDDGLVDAIGYGYGAGNYGAGTYGGVTEAETRPRIWSIDNWGQNLNAVCTNGALYEWQPLPQYNELVANGDFAASAGWILGTNVTISGGHCVITAGTATDLERDLTGILSGGVTYVLDFDITVSAGTLQFRVESEADPMAPVDIAFGEAIGKTGHYNRRFSAPANPTLIKFSTDSSFAGTIDNVSIKMVSTAYRVMDAPQYSRAMFVDPHRFVVLLGTVQQNGEFNSMCVKWCDQENNTTWTANSDNQAGEYVLAHGSEIRGGCASRDQNLVWTDDALYTMRYDGSTDIFTFSLVGTGCGLIAPRAFVEFNGVVFWWGTDGNFYIYQGSAPQVLTCTIRRDVTDNLTKMQQTKISAGVNPAYGEVWFHYPDGRDGSGNECSRAAVYNWDGDNWYPHLSPRSTWVGQGVFPNPIAFGTDGAIYYHESGNTANGDPLDWFLETGALDMGEGDTWFNLMRIVPDFESQQGSIDIDVYTRQWPAAPWNTPKRFTSSTSTQKIDCRLAGRQMKLKFSSTAAPAFARFGAVKADIMPSGAVR